MRIIVDDLYARENVVYVDTEGTLTFVDPAVEARVQKLIVYTEGDEPYDVRLKRLPNGMRSLSFLVCIRCAVLESVPDYLGETLAMLTVSRCPSLRTLPARAPKLRELRIGGECDVRLPNDMRSLVRLDCFEADRLKDLSGFFFPELKFVDIRRCRALESAAFYAPDLKTMNCSFKYGVRNLPLPIHAFDLRSMYIEGVGRGSDTDSNHANHYVKAQRAELLQWLGRVFVMHRYRFRGHPELKRKIWSFIC